MKEYIYLIRQTQPAENYNDYVFVAFKNESAAIKEARRLNKEYGVYAKFNEKWDFIDVEDNNYYRTHYYAVNKMEIE